MKKIISFDKNLEFSSMIGDISSISFEHTLSFKDQSNINGEFLIFGSYRLTEASRLDEKFEFKIPVDIMLSETIDIDSADIEVEDFSYKVLNDDTLVCHIEIKIEAVEQVIIEEDNNIEINNLESLSSSEVLLDRECDGDIVDNSMDIDNKDILDVQSDIIEDNTNNIDNSSNVGSLFSSFKDTEETFSTYSVYIIRNDESIDSILTKYKINKEELENYNDLTNLSVGSKLIIPSTNEKS